MHVGMGYLLNFNPVLKDCCMFSPPYYLYMNLNATKRPLGHFDVNVLKLGNSEKIKLYAFLK